MRVTTEKGIFIIYGEITYSYYKNIDEGRINLKTSTPFRDQKGITRNKTYTWVINITNGQTTFINPKRHKHEYAVVEATPYDDYDKFWYHPNGKQKHRLKLKALFVNPLPEYHADLTPTKKLDAVEYEPKGSSYIVWWRSDQINDNDPLVTGVYDPYLAGEYDDFMKGGFQDDMRSDMEFFYEDERWSRD